MSTKKTIAYIRTSTQMQGNGADAQKLTIYEFCQARGWRVDETICVQISASKSREARRINELIERLQPGDRLVATELSRVSRSMAEAITLVTGLGEKGVEVVFTRQPELSTEGSAAKLVLAVMAYLAESEREFLRLRTREGLAAARARGAQIGRRKGQRNKNHPLREHRSKIAEWLRAGLDLASIQKLLAASGENVEYHVLRYFVVHDAGLQALRSK